MAARQVLVDTSVFIDYFRKKNKSKTLLWKLTSSNDQLFISVVTDFEFYCGCKTAERKAEARELLESYEGIDFTSQHALCASEIYNELLSKNQIIDVLDIMIAGVARHEGFSVATFNRDHFERVDNLKVLSDSP